jgi:hypothetical protein
MAIKIISREEWGAAKPKSRTPRPANQLDGVAIHWFGSPKAASSHEGCAELLRGVQRGHMNHPTEKYVDIAYNHAVCPHGFAYELRGFDVQSGANGFGSANRSHAAIVYMAGTGDPFTDEAKPVLAALIREWQKRGAGTDVKPHGFFTGSECPGPQIRDWLDAKGYLNGEEPQPGPSDPEPVPPWLMEFVEWRLVHDADPELRPKSVPRKVPASAWEAASQMHRLMSSTGPQEPFLDWAAWRLAGGKKSERPRSLPAKVPKEWWDGLKRIKRLPTKT